MTRIHHDGGTVGAAWRIVEAQHQLAVIVVEGAITQEPPCCVEVQGDLGVAVGCQRFEQRVLIQRLALGHAVGVVEIDGKGRTGVLGTVRNLLSGVKDHIGELAVAGNLDPGDCVAARRGAVGYTGDVVPVDPDTRCELEVGIGFVLVLVDHLTADGVIQRALGQRIESRVGQVVEGAGREGFGLGGNDPYRGSVLHGDALVDLDIGTGLAALGALGFAIDNNVADLLHPVGGGRCGVGAGEQPVGVVVLVAVGSGFVQRQRNGLAADDRIDLSVLVGGGCDGDAHTAVHRHIAGGRNLLDNLHLPGDVVDIAFSLVGEHKFVEPFGERHIQGEVAVSIGGDLLVVDGDLGTGVGSTHEGDRLLEGGIGLFGRRGHCQLGEDVLAVEGVVVIVQHSLGAALQILLEPGQVVVQVAAEAGKILRGDELQRQLVILSPAALLRAGLAGEVQDIERHTCCIGLLAPPGHHLLIGDAGIGGGAFSLDRHKVHIAFLQVGEVVGIAAVLGCVGSCCLGALCIGGTVGPYRHCEHTDLLAGGIGTQSLAQLPEGGVALLAHIVFVAHTAAIELVAEVAVLLGFVVVAVHHQALDVIVLRNGKTMFHRAADRGGVHLGERRNAAILHTGEQVIDHIDIQPVFPCFA